METTPQIANPRVYAYARVSTIDQVKGNSLDLQVEQVTAHAAKLQEQIPNLDWGCVFIERGESAFKHNLEFRTEGAKLFRAVKPGDHVVFALVSRGFRNFRDCVNVVDRWTEQGVTVHVLQLGADTRTAEGRYIINQLALIAQLESDQKAEYLAQIQALRAKRGLPSNQNRPQGFKYVRRGKNLASVEDYDERREMVFLAFCKNDLKMGCEPILREIEKLLAFSQKRKPISRAGWGEGKKAVKRKWQSYDKFRNAVRKCEEWGMGTLKDYLEWYESNTVFVEHEECWIHYLYRAWFTVSDPPNGLMTEEAFFNWMGEQKLEPKDLTADWWQDNF